MGTWSSMPPWSANQSARQKADDSGFEVDNVLSITSDSSASARYRSAQRFTNVQVPRGATITGVFFQAYIPSTKADDANADYYLEATDDAVDFVANASVNNRTRTSASASFTGDDQGTGYKLIGLTDSVQEVVNRSGWNPGQAMMVIGVGRSNASKSLDFRQGWVSGAFATEPPILMIFFTPPGVGRTGQRAFRAGSGISVTGSVS